MPDKSPAEILEKWGNFVRGKKCDVMAVMAITRNDAKSDLVFFPKKIKSDDFCSNSLGVSKPYLLCSMNVARIFTKVLIHVNIWIDI